MIKDEKNVPGWKAGFWKTKIEVNTFRMSFPGYNYNHFKLVQNRKVAWSSEKNGLEKIFLSKVGVNIKEDRFLKNFSNLSGFNRISMEHKNMNFEKKNSEKSIRVVQI